MHRSLHGSNHSEPSGNGRQATRRRKLNHVSIYCMWKLMRGCKWRAWNAIFWRTSVLISYLSGWKCSSWVQNTKQNMSTLNCDNWSFTGKNLEKERILIHQIIHWNFNIRASNISSPQNPFSFKRCHTLIFLWLESVCVLSIFLNSDEKIIILTL